MATCQDILEQLRTAVAVVAAGDDGAFRVGYLNQSAQSLFGRSAARAVGMPLQALVRDPHARPAALRRVLETGAPFTKRELPLPTAGGVARVNFTVAPLAGAEPGAEPGGELLAEFEPLDRFLRIDRDERHAALQETMRRLARGLAHEIKNPLGGIRGAAQLLERQLADAGQREYTTVIMAEADRLRRLADRMLGPRDKPRFASVNVHQVIERVVTLLEAEEKDRDPRIAFRREYDPSLPPVRGDFEQLVQATLNVLANAAEALRDAPAPRIALRTRVLRECTIGPIRHRLAAFLQFEDNGPGVPPAIADSLFYPTISGRPDGSGLGLAVTQTILAQHGGLVECASEPGRTAFSFYLPIHAKDKHDHGHADGADDR